MSPSTTLRASPSLILPNEKKQSAVVFLKALLAYYQSLGIAVACVMTDNVLRREAELRSGHTASFADERQRYKNRPSGFRRQWMALSTIANTRSASGAAFTVLNTRCRSERKA